MKKNYYLLPNLVFTASDVKQDIDAELHETLKPNALRQSRPEYQDFPLIVFRDHMHQEKSCGRERSYWLNCKEQMYH
jgi:hypothetical protein